MSTIPLVPESVDANDPRLTEIHDYHSYDPVELGHDGYHIVPRYEGLRTTTKQAVVELSNRDYLEAGSRLANCGKFGSVYMRCKKGKRARGHRHTCHMWICLYCGQSHNLLHCWMRKRSAALHTDRQVGIEIRGPVDGDIEDVCRRLAAWFERRGVDSVRRLGIDPKPVVSRVRMVLATRHLDYTATLARLREMAGAGWSIQPYRESDPIKVLKWMFASTENVLTACGYTQAKLLLKYNNRHLIKTAGDYYREVPVDERGPEITEQEQESMGYQLLQRQCTCGECDGIMEVIPWNERHTETTEQIEERYESVDWSSCYDPFKISRKGTHTPNSIAPTVIYVLGDLVDTSPPPL